MNNIEAVIFDMDGLIFDSKIMLKEYDDDFPIDKIYKEKIEVMTNFIDKNGAPLKEGIHIPDMKEPDEDMKKNAFMIKKSLVEVKDYLKNVKCR